MAGHPNQQNKLANKVNAKRCVGSLMPWECKASVPEADETETQGQNMLTFVSALSISALLHCLLTLKTLFINLFVC